MKRIDIVKHGRHWFAEDHLVVYVRALTKAGCIRRTAAIARRSLEPVSVRIHLANGRIEEERTYPHAGDPARSPG